MRHPNPNQNMADRMTVLADTQFEPVFDAVYSAALEEGVVAAQITSLIDRAVKAALREIARVKSEFKVAAHIVGA